VAVAVADALRVEEAVRDADPVADALAVGHALLATSVGGVVRKPAGGAYSRAFTVVEPTLESMRAKLTTLRVAHEVSAAATSACVASGNAPR
jgi:hypothetical protein